MRQRCAVRGRREIRSRHMSSLLSAFSIGCWAVTRPSTLQAVQERHEPRGSTDHLIEVCRATTLCTSTCPREMSRLFASALRKSSRSSVANFHRRHVNTGRGGGTRVRARTSTRARGLMRAVARQVSTCPLAPWNSSSEPAIRRLPVSAQRDAEASDNSLFRRPQDCRPVAKSRQLVAHRDVSRRTSMDSGVVLDPTDGDFGSRDSRHDRASRDPWFPLDPDLRCRDDRDTSLAPASRCDALSSGVAFARRLT